MKYIKRKSALKPISGNIVDTFNINNKTTNAPSLRLMIDLIYPVGRGFMDFTDTDYSNYLGCTWERELVGMFPVGYNPNDTSFDSIGEKGGEKTVTLNVNQIPPHTHTFHRQQWYGADIEISSDSGAIYSWKSTTGGATSKTYANKSGSDLANTGGGQAHNNLPPYQVVSYWKRVAPKVLITFQIRDDVYQAEEGMTWAEWCDSKYNTGGWYVSANVKYIYISSGYVSGNDDGSPPEGPDIIIANHRYGFQLEK